MPNFVHRQNETCVCVSQKIIKTSMSIQKCNYIFIFYRSPPNSHLDSKIPWNTIILLPDNIICDILESRSVLPEFSVSLARSDV